MEKRTLTNLYNQRPTWLANAHAKLDAAVFAAPNTTLINPFEVPQGQEEEFVRNWQAAAEQLRDAEGFISTRLHQSLHPQAKFRFINVAEWESPQHFQAAMRTEAFQEIARKLPFAAYPALYGVIVEDRRQ